MGPIFGVLLPRRAYTLSNVVYTVVVADTKQLIAARVDPEMVTEIEALAVIELEGNTSMMVRRLLREALDARSVSSRPVGPAESVAQKLSSAKVAPGRVAPAFQEPAAVARAAEAVAWADGVDPDDPGVTVEKPVRSRPAKMTERERLRAMKAEKLGRS